MKLLIITPYPYAEAPSRRFRFEQYLDTLEHKGFQITQHSFLSKEGWKILYKDGKNLSKAIHILNGFLRRLFSLASIAQYDFILIHREASPVGPPVFEWAIAKIFRKKIIYDFDDAIWLKDPSETGLKALVKWKSKVASICQWSYTVSCGNEYLANFARHYNNNVILNPTTIDTKNVHIPHSRPENALPVVGWTGTHSTMPYLEIILPVLKKLQQKIPFKFLIISNKPPGFQLDTMEYILWSKTTESFDFRVLKYWHKHYPKVRLAALVENERSVTTNLANLGFKPNIYSPYYKLIDKNDVKMLHQKRIKVIPWTVNEAEEMKRLISWKVDGIITDYPNIANELGLTIPLKQAAEHK